jgi:hypothetical protein
MFSLFKATFEFLVKLYSKDLSAYGKKEAEAP